VRRYHPIRSDENCQGYIVHQAKKHQHPDANCQTLCDVFAFFAFLAVHITNAQLIIPPIPNGPTQTGQKRACYS